MATKLRGTTTAAGGGARSNAKDGLGEYSINSDNSSGQEWILDAYQSLEPGVR